MQTSRGKINLGEQKYDAFVAKITTKQVMTPHTSLLSKLADLDEDSDDFLSLALTELLKNFKPPKQEVEL